MLQKWLLGNNLQHRVKSPEKTADGFYVSLPIGCCSQERGRNSRSSAHGLAGFHRTAQLVCEFRKCLICREEEINRLHQFPWEPAWAKLAVTVTDGHEPSKLSHPCLVSWSASSLSVHPSCWVPAAVKHTEWAAEPLKDHCFQRPQILRCKKLGKSSAAIGKIRSSGNWVITSRTAHRS